MDHKENMVWLKCDCNCSTFVVEKSAWDDGTIDYNICVQDSRYDHNHNTLWGRIKSAWKILFGKPVYYNDIYVGDPIKFKEFVNELNALCREDTAVGQAANHSEAE